MTREKRKQLSLLLDEYYNELSKTCNYDCYNCELRILESYGSGTSCSIETVTRKIDEDLYEEEREMTKDLCPICGYELNFCQCFFNGSAHPDRNKERNVVQDHLYLLSDKQLLHLLKLQRYWQTSYGDEERAKMLKCLEENGTAAIWRFKDTN